MSVKMRVDEELYGRMNYQAGQFQRKLYKMGIAKNR